VSQGEGTTFYYQLLYTLVLIAIAMKGSLRFAFAFVFASLIMRLEILVIVRFDAMI
jgi:hypothetical protein